LALFLAAALLFCHGAFGALHQAHQSATGVQPQHASGHASHEVHGGAGLATGGHAAGPGGGCISCVAYSAVMLVVSLGTLLTLLKRARPWTSIAAPSSPTLGSVTPVLYPPRGPTLRVLQVFRL
jgi:hypothetical protein